MVHQAMKVPLLSSERYLFKVCNPMKPAKWLHYQTVAMGMFTITSLTLVKTNSNPTALLKTTQVVKNLSSSLVKNPTARPSCYHCYTEKLLCINRTIQWVGGSEHEDNRDSNGLPEVCASWNQERYKNEEHRCSGIRNRKRMAPFLDRKAYVCWALLTWEASMTCHQFLPHTPMLLQCKNQT